jgi:hypothetical protein
MNRFNDMPTTEPSEGSAAFGRDDDASSGRAGAAGQNIKVKTSWLLNTPNRRIVSAVVRAELVSSSIPALATPVITVRAVGWRTCGEFLIACIRLLNGRFGAHVQTPLEMNIEVALPAGSAEAAMPLQILLIGVNRRLRIVAANWVFQPLLRMQIVVGGPRASARGHANMIAGAASFPPYESLDACIRSKWTAAWLTPTRRLRVVRTRLAAYVGRYANMIAGAARLAPNKTFRASIWSKIADGHCACRRKENTGDEPRHHFELLCRTLLHIAFLQMSSDTKKERIKFRLGQLAPDHI